MRKAKGAAWAAALLLSACGTKPHPASRGSALARPDAVAQVKESVHPAVSRERDSVADTAAAKPSRSGKRAPQERPPLPPGLVTGKSIEVPMEGDRALRVAHAGDGNDHALVYLHGMCGDPQGAEPWLDRALREGTLIVLRANVPCPDRPGYKWPKDVDGIQARIDAALARVRADRNGLLDTEKVTLVGYSQGAHRAELLAAQAPERYPAVVLGGPPTAPLPESFRPGTSVAVLGGELENTDHMREGAAALSEAGLRSEFFLLPGAHHGGYGPQGPAVMDRVFNWLAAGQLSAPEPRSVRLE